MMRVREWVVGCGGVYGSRVGATPLPLQSDDDDDGDDGDVDGREDQGYRKVLVERFNFCPPFCPYPPSSSKGGVPRNRQKRAPEV